MDCRLKERRDVYGLSVNADYEELLLTYTPIWSELDDCQVCQWSRFINTAAAQLGISLGRGSDSEEEDRPVRLDEGSNGVVEAVLQELLARGERHAPELWSDLVKHVAGGIPSCLRAVAWPLFLRARSGKEAAAQGQCPAKSYVQLLAVQQRLFAAVVGPVQQAAAAPQQRQQQATAVLKQQADVPSSSTAEQSSSCLQDGSAANGATLKATSSQDTTGPVAAVVVAAETEQLLAAVTEAGLPLSAEDVALWRAGCRTWASQIDKDVHRTFPGQPWLSSGAGQACLTRLLSCFCLAAPQLGYCQGMNYVAGGMLLLLRAGLAKYRSELPTSACSSVASSCESSSNGHNSTQEPPADSTLASAASQDAAAAVAAAVPAADGKDSNTTAAAAAITAAAAAAGTCDVADEDQDMREIEATVFECLLGFAKQVLPGYYSPAMVAPQVDQRVLSHLAQEHLPVLSAQLAALGLSPAQPCPAWLLAGFAASGMPLATVARLWDVAFFEQSGAALIRGCLALLHLFSGAFEAVADCCDAGLLLQALPGLAFDGDRLLSLSRDAYDEVDPDALIALQHCFRAEVLAEMEQAAAAARKHHQHQHDKATPATAPVTGADAAATAPGSSSRQLDGLAAAAVDAAVGEAVAAADGTAGGLKPAAAGGDDAADADVHAHVITACNAEHPEGNSKAEQPVGGLPWVPDFAESTTPNAAAAAVVSTGARGEQGLQEPYQQNRHNAALASSSLVAHTNQGEVGPDEEEEEGEEESGSLLHPGQPQQRKLGSYRGRSSQECSSRGSSSSSNTATAAAAGSTAVAAQAVGGATLAGSGGSGVSMKGHSQEVSGSKAIALAMSIAAVPGLPVLPTSPPPNQQHQQQLSMRTHSSSALVRIPTQEVAAAGGVGGDGTLTSRSSSFFRSLGMQRSSSAQAVGQGSSGSSSHYHSHQQQQQVLQLQLRSHSSSRGLRQAAAAAAGGLHNLLLSPPSNHSNSNPPGLTLRATEDFSSECGEDVEGGAWMLLGGSSPRVAAAAAATAAAAAAAAGRDGGSRPGSPACSSSMAAAAAAAGCDVKLLAANLRDNYGLPRLNAQVRELMAAAAALTEGRTAAEPGPAGTFAAEEATSAQDNLQQGQQHDGKQLQGNDPSEPSAFADAASAAGVEDGSGGGDTSGSSDAKNALLAQFVALTHALLAVEEELVADLAQQTASVTALQCQLDRSMWRMEQQDSELATKDEIIERHQQELRYYENLNSGGNSSPRKHHIEQQQHVVQHPDSSGDGSGSSSGGGRHRFMLHRGHVQQGRSSKDGGRSSSSGQGFMAAALARFSSPTKLRAPSRQQQHQAHYQGSSGVGSLSSTFASVLGGQQQPLASVSNSASSSAWKLTDMTAVQHPSQQTPAAAGVGASSVTEAATGAGGLTGTGGHVSTGPVGIDWQRLATM